MYIRLSDQTTIYQHDNVLAQQTWGVWNENECFVLFHLVRVTMEDHRRSTTASQQED